MCFDKNIFHFFKNKLFQIFHILLFCFIVASFIFGCAGEKEKIQNIKKLELKTGLCLEEFNQTFNLFLNGTIKEDELASFWICIENYIKIFSKYVKGKNEEYYTAIELKTYFENQFLDPVEKIPDELFSHMMRVKNIVIGGDKHRFTKTEIQRVIKFVRLIAGISYEALPYMRIYFFKDKLGEGVSHEQIEKANLALHDMVKDFSHWFKEVKSSYLFSELKSFLIAWDEQLKRQVKNENLLLMNDKTTLRQIIDSISLLQTLKVVFVGEDKSQILGTQWGDFFKSVAQSLEVFLRYKYYFSENEGELNLYNFIYVNKMVKVIYEMLVQGQKKHKDHVIPHQEFYEIIEEVGERMTFPLGLNADALKKLWSALVDYGLKPLDQDKPSSRGKGMNKGHLKELFYEYQIWYETQIYLNSLLEGKNYVIDSELKKMSVVQVGRVIHGALPLVLDRKNRVRLNPLDPSISFDFKSYFSLNWQRAVIRILIRGFSQNEDSRRNAIELKKEELTVAAGDLKDLLVALGVASSDETPEMIAKNIFRLASSFMPHARGGDSLSLAEGLEYMAFIFSGIETGNPLYQKAESECLISKKKQSVSSTCYRKLFHSQIENYLEALPEFVQYFKKLSEEEQFRFQVALENAVRPEGYSEKEITQSEINKTFILIQYVETYLMKFDNDLSGNIDKEEALRGFPIFKNVLKEVIEENENKDKKSDLNSLTNVNENELKKVEINKIDREKCVYTWFLRHGTVPKKWSPIFIGWCLTRLGWGKINADRTRLLEVLANLSQASSKKEEDDNNEEEDENDWWDDY